LRQKVIFQDLTPAPCDNRLPVTTGLCGSGYQTNCHGLSQIRGQELVGPVKSDAIKNQPLLFGGKVTLIGVISDTHGLLRPEALQALRGAELIIHAGDIGKPEVIAGLQALAPVTAVRGNCDQGAWADAYPLRKKMTIGEIPFLVLHDRMELKSLVSREGPRVVISGHSHTPSIEEMDGVLYLNPGSAGRRRFKLPVTVALLTVHGGKVAAEIVDLALPAHK
jgi:uncharacterized protein